MGDTHTPHDQPSRDGTELETEPYRAKTRARAKASARVGSTGNGW